jgi:hypothetical protein
VKINPKVLEDLFCAAKPKPVSAEAADGEGAPKQAKAQVINLLDMKRSQNICAYPQNFFIRKYWPNPLHL